MKHGPLALIEEGMPVVVLSSKRQLLQKNYFKYARSYSKGCKSVMLITNKSKDEIVSENIWETIEVESTNDDLLTFPY